MPSIKTMLLLLTWIVSYDGVGILTYSEGPGFISRLGDRVLCAFTRSFHIAIRYVLISQSLALYNL
jgi:hypothetical protein